MIWILAQNSNACIILCGSPFSWESSEYSQNILHSNIYRTVNFEWCPDNNLSAIQYELVKKNLDRSWCWFRNEDSQGKEN